MSKQFDDMSLSRRGFLKAGAGLGGMAAMGTILPAGGAWAAGSDKPEAVRGALEKTKGFSGIGGTFTYTPTDHAGLGPDAFIMLTIDKGDWKIIGQ